LRLEYVLAVLIVLTILAMNANVRANAVVSTQNVKELEFSNTTLIEVTTQKRVGIAYAEHGIRKHGVLTLEGLVYSNDTITQLSADKARYLEKTIYLEGDVTLLHYKGLRFFTNKANFDKQKEEINITAPFTAYMGKNKIDGEKMQYNMKTEEIYATRIKAEITIADNDLLTKGKEN